MPLTRYQIRNEYGLADPELYKAAERDDPEALLEGVAMAGLVGVLRQLGDLAEFAAEIFHDLHEEVMSTASRGHGLMARVHQLEADFPSIEKAFLSQTSHSPFFSAPGVDWHPNLRSQQNLITRGDLPRFVMDSYEECRGPPRLFLLDKFDVAGAGACLKRYTDPSFFKGEAISPVAATGDVQREKKTRKLKKKGARKRNGETPEIAPTSHAKLHQLLLEERFENGYSDPTRVVKLKKRQLNGYPFDSETGKSYMEKFVETPSPEHKVVHEVPVNPPRLKFRSDNTSEKAVEVHEIDTVSPVSKSQQRNEFACSPPYEPEVLLKPSIDVPKEEVFDRASEMVPEPSLGGESDENPSKLPEVMDKKKFAVGIGAEGRKEGRADGYPSDEVTSEVDNFTDALTTMESEMETDNEHRTKNDMGYLNLEKHGMESDAYEEQLELAAHLSDSQSIGNFSSATDDGNSSFKKGRSSFSYSDSLSNVVENTLSDGEGADKVPPSNETYISEFLEAPSNKLSTSVEIQKLKSVELELPNNMCIEAVKIPDAKETSCVSAKLDETPHDFTQFGCESSKADDIGTILSCSAAVFSSLPSQNGDHKLSAVHGETRAIDKLDEENVDVISDSPVDLSFVSEITHEKKGNDYSKNEMCQASNADKHCIENFDGEERSSAHSGPPAAEQLLSLALAEEMSSVTEVDDAIPSTKVDSENLAPMVDGLRTYSFSEQQSSGIPDDVPQLNLDSAEAGVTPDEITTPVDGQEIDGHCCNVEGAGREAIPVELPYHYPNYADHEVQLHSDDKITGMVQTEDVTASAASPDNAVENSIDYTSDIMCSPSELVISHESFSELRDQHQKGLEFNDAILPECLVELEIQQEVNQLEVASIDSDPIPLKSEVPDDLQDVSLAKQAQISSYICDNITTSIPAQLRNQEPESSSPQSDNLLDSCEDALTPSTCLLEPGVPLQQFSRLQVDSDHTESSHVDKMLTQSPTYKDQELCVDASQSSPGDVLNQAQMFEFSEKSAVRELDIADEAVDSSDHVLPYHGLTEVTHNNHASSASHPENLPCQPLPVEFVPESAMRDLDIAEKAVDSSDHVLPCHSLTEVTPNNHVSIASHPEDLPCQPLSAEYVPESSIQVADGVKQGTGLIDSSVPSFGLHSVAIEVNHSAESGPDNLQRQLSSSEFLLQPAGLENCSIKGAMDQLDARPPLFGVFPVATQDHLEMPPLPPLPPMQWRMGKVQNTPLGSLGESVQCVQDSHTHVLSSAADEEVRFGFSTSERGILQPENPFLSHSTVEDEKSKHNVELSDGNSVQLTSYSSLTPNMVNGLAGEGTQSLNPFQNRDRAKDDFYASGGEMIQFSCSSYSPEPAVEDATTRYDHVSMQGNLMQPMNQVVAETAVDGDTSQPVTNDFGRQGDNSCNTFPPPQSIPGEKWQNSASTSGAEIAWFSKPSTLVPFFEIAKPNGNSKMKLPRPRSPLIDAVAAHDKSTLRRVTERVRPQIEPKVDERDSLLEQIRSKSFNLKPAVVTRPSIQGPKTNLKVAAILEKANAIRQALAGSDDEDDSDSWSDS